MIGSGTQPVVINALAAREGQAAATVIAARNISAHAASAPRCPDPMCAECVAARRRTRERLAELDLALEALWAPVTADPT